MKSRSRKLFHSAIAIIGLAFVSSGSSAFAQQAQSQVMNTTTSDTQEAPKLSSGELDSLVAPIALYPDPLLAQTLAASTYPLEIIQLQQWMDRNKNLQGKALADAVAKQRGTQAFSDWWSFQTWFSGWPAMFNGRRTWETHSWRSNLT